MNCDVGLPRGDRDRVRGGTLHHLQDVNGRSGSHVPRNGDGRLQNRSLHGEHGSREAHQDGPRMQVG